MKKLTALFMALVMMMAMATTASAITINNTANGTYKAYKVLEIEGTTKDAIRYKNSISAWQGVVTANATVDGDNYVTAFNETAEAFAEAVVAVIGRTPDKSKTASGTSVEMDFEDGYWVLESPTEGAVIAFTVFGGKIIKDNGTGVVGEYG